MSKHVRQGRPKPGDWIEVNVVAGGPSRYGLILEVLGAPGHEDHRVRWDEEHETLHFPAQGTRELDEPPAHRAK
jgi:hypothetical protein